jgi:hypothetical protein
LSFWEGQGSGKLFLSSFLDERLQVNERENPLVDCFVIEQPMDTADIVNNLRKIDRKEDFVNRESTLLLRIKEMQIKSGTGKNKTFTGGKRRLISH